MRGKNEVFVISTFEVALFELDGFHEFRKNVKAKYTLNLKFVIVKKDKNKPASNWTG